MIHRADRTPDVEEDNKPGSPSPRRRRGKEGGKGAETEGMAGNPILNLRPGGIPKVVKAAEFRFGGWPLCQSGRVKTLLHTMSAIGSVGTRSPSWR